MYQILADRASFRTFISTSAREKSERKKKFTRDTIERIDGERLFRFIQSPIGRKHSIIQRGHLTAPRAFKTPRESSLWSARVETTHPLAAIGRPFFSPIFIQLVSRGQSISPITSSQSWHVPHPRLCSRADLACPQGRVLPPYLNLIFLQSALKALQKDTSFPFFFLVFFCSFHETFHSSPFTFFAEQIFDPRIRSRFPPIFSRLGKKFFSFSMSVWMERATWLKRRI